MKMKKTIAALVAIAMIFGCVIGGTIAWLMDKSNTVTNTFATSDVDITLTESDNLDLQMVPGKTITKDPKVTVVAGSEKCYLFVKIDKSETYNTYLEDYAVITEGDDKWTLLSESENKLTKVYYITVPKEVAKEGKDYPVLVDNEVKVSTDVTRSQMNDIKNGDVAFPTLTFTAYAIQYDYLTDQNNDGTVDVNDAWALANAQ